MSPDSQFAGQRTQVSLRATGGAAPREAGEDSSQSSWQPDVPQHGSTSHTPDSTNGADTVSFHLPGEADVAAGGLAPGFELGRYVLVRKIGRGGMGAVWLATDTQLDRQVAIKVLRPERQRDPAAINQFLDECRRLGNLVHTGILPVYDCGIDQGICYLVSEFVAGGTLGHQIKRTPPSYSEAAELVARIADAAHFAHLRGIVHRDIKPGNILMRARGVPLLADFGLAISEEEQLAAPAGTLGTFAYMSPEQLRGDSQFVDGRADIYSLGVLLYQLLTARLPFLADNAEQYQELVLRRDPRPPRSIREDIPRELEAICLKCLARNPAERYTTAADLSAALRAFLDAPQPHSRRKQLTAVAIGLATAAVLIIAALVMSRDIDPGREPARQPSGTTDPPAMVPAPARIDWMTADGGASVRSFADRLSLYRIGEDSLGELSLNVQLEQRIWTGNLGVYWGFRPVAEPAGWYQLEYLQIMPLAQGGFRLRVVRMHIDPTAPHISNSVELAYKDIDPVDAGTHTLGFEIRQGNLERLLWDDTDLQSLVEQRNAIAQGDPISGTYGLISVGGHGKFSRLRINERNTPFDSSMHVELP
jgi:hypothetical protein